MAIKNIAFDLYVQKRQLPKKIDSTDSSKAYFFENVIDDQKIINKNVSLPMTSIDIVNPMPLVSENFSDTFSIESCNNTINVDRIVHDDPQFLPQVKIEDIQNEVPFSNKYDQETDGSAFGKMIVEEPEVIVNNDGITYNPTSAHDSSIKFLKLVGNQQSIVIALYKNTQINDLCTTKELTLDEISILSGVNKKSLKNTLFRLTKAGFLIRIEQKIGRGGWVKYKINDHIKNEIQNIGIASIVGKK